jgi:hypothetical protein
MMPCERAALGPVRKPSITKHGSAPVPQVLVEAAWVAVRAPGPMRAFYERVRARRGAQVAAVATARKLMQHHRCLRSMHFAETGPVKLYYESRGRGPAVLQGSSRP